MTGTAVLYLEDERMIILRDVEKKVAEEIKSQCGERSCSYHLEERRVDLGPVKHVIWMDRADIGD